MTALSVDLFVKLLVMGAFGVGLEVIFTSGRRLLDPSQRDRVQAFGFASLWYVPIYGLMLPAGLYIVLPLVEDLTWFLKFPLLGLLLHLGEFLTMGVLRLINGASPSEEEYLQSRRSIKGLARWDYYPAFVFLGFLYVRLFDIFFPGA